MTLAFSFAALHGQTKCEPVKACDRVQLASGEQFVVTLVSDSTGPDGRPVYIATSMSTGYQRVILDREVVCHFTYKARI